MSADQIQLMLCGDVMLGRGIDQILPHPGLPALYEDCARSALDYVWLAEDANGRLARPVSFAYVWGDALAALGSRRPALRIINLETAITRSDRPELKGINYRMSPANVPCLTAAEIDCCVLANNHVLDWGRDGLVETLRVLHGEGIRTAGAGRDADEAMAPAVFDLAGRGRVLVHAVACPSSGIPVDWAAKARLPGVWLVEKLSRPSAEAVAAAIASRRQPGDIVVLSVHWGGNWGYAVADEQKDFARTLVAGGQVDIVYGHSSHHFKAMEIFRGKPIFYGCGDLLNDYEGIRGHESYRSDLGLMYFVSLSWADGTLELLEVVPFRICNFRLQRATGADAEWVRSRLDRECRRFDGRISLQGASEGSSLRVLLGA
jgi:poly-gamma-glutamate synthesis protein (capsule biosynthesis protein)